MVFYVSLFVIIVCMVMSLRTLFIPSTLKEKHLSVKSLIYIMSVYATIMIGFALIYVLFYENGYFVFSENGDVITGDYKFMLKTSLYFSGVTIFSVGFGDISPVGVGRFIAIVEALIGYSIPAAYVVRSVILWDDKS
jgi:potassium channel LctB